MTERLAALAGLPVAAAPVARRDFPLAAFVLPEPGQASVGMPGATFPVRDAGVTDRLLSSAGRVASVLGDVAEMFIPPSPQQYIALQQGYSLPRGAEVREFDDGPRRRDESGNWVLLNRAGNLERLAALPLVAGGPAGTLGAGFSSGIRGRGKTAAPRTDEEIARSFGMTVEELQQVRAVNMAQSNRFNEPAERLRQQAEDMGFSARVETPGDTTSRYLRVSAPGWRQDVTVRIADHAQPTEFVPDPRGTGGLVRMPVGGYSQELRARHPAADFSVDPRTRYTEEDALEFLRGLLARGVAPVGVGLGAVASE